MFIAHNSDLAELESIFEAGLSAPLRNNALKWQHFIYC